MFRDRFWLSLALTVPVVLLSPDMAMWFGYSLPSLPGLELVPAILGTIVFVYGGLVFLRGAQGELADRRPGMMTLIALAILVAFVTSWAGTLELFEVEIWWELATLITIMLLGHWLEMRSIAQARGALAALAELLPDTAERVTASGTARLKRYERHLIAGVEIRVRVFQAGRVGKYTSFLIRRGRSPLRRDRCLAPGAMLPSKCPAG